MLRLVLLAPVLFAPLSAPSGQEIVRIAAVVNDDVISVMDVFDRTRLLIAMAGLPDNQEVFQRLMPQVLRSLIDERLQLQEAKALGIKVRESAIKENMAIVEREKQVAAGDLPAWLAARNVVEATLIDQIHAALAWRDVVRQRLKRQVVVGNEEVDDAVRRLSENSGRPRHLVSEIFLAVENLSDEEDIRRNALRIIRQVREGANFAALAQTFSQNANAASGGDLGWVVPGQLPEEVDAALANMQPGQLAGPIRSRGGYYIVALRDRRQPGAGRPDQVVVQVKQIILPFPESPTESDIQDMLATAQAIRQKVNDCGQVGVIDEMLGRPSVTDMGKFTIADLSQPLQAPLMALAPGQMTAPMRSGSGNIVMFMVCERISPEETLPDADKIRALLEREKLDFLARRYLRDLRRAAFLDVRV